MPLPPLPLPVPVFPIRRIYFALTAGHSLRRALARGTSRRLPMCKNSGFCTNGKARGRLFQPVRQSLQAGPAATVGHGHRRQPWRRRRASAYAGRRATGTLYSAQPQWRVASHGDRRRQNGPSGLAIRPVSHCDTACLAMRNGRHGKPAPTAAQQNKSRTAWHQPYRPAHALHCALCCQAHQSFCSTSISVKVSMMSPCCMSLKLTRLKPHSSPAATSLASSL